MQLVKSFLFSGLSSDSQPFFPSCSLPSPSLGLSAAPFLLSGLVCFFCTSALFTQKQFCLAWHQSLHSPGNQGIILHPLTKPWHVPSAIMELRQWAYLCCQAQFDAWPNINYAWSNVLGLRCPPLICHSLFLPHLETATISVQLAGKPYTENSRLSGTMKMAEILQQPFSRVFCALHILFWENVSYWCCMNLQIQIESTTLEEYLQCSVWQGSRQAKFMHSVSSRWD